MLIDDQQQSALFLISNPDIVPVLVQHRIDLTLKDKCGWTALRSWQEHLQECGEDPDAQREAQAMVAALQLAEHNSGWQPVPGNKRRASGPRSRSPPRSRSLLAHGRAAGEA